MPRKCIGLLSLAIGCSSQATVPVVDGAITTDTAFSPGDATPLSDATPLDDSASEAAPCKPPPGSACTIAPVCGCSPAENCVLSGGKLGCAPAGTKKLNELCEGPNECVRGFVCELQDFEVPKPIGICKPYCSGSGDCPPSSSCQNLGTISICHAACDPISEVACAPGGGCQFSGDGKTRCYPAGSGTLGVACNRLSCRAGYTCMGNCYKICRMGVTGDCVLGKTCVPGWVSGSFAGTSYGVCSL